MNTMMIPAATAGSDNAMRSLESDAALAGLAAAWHKAKSDEAEANRRRLEAEAKMLDLIGTQAEGTAKFGAGDYAVSVSFGSTTSVDEDKLREIADRVPVDIQKRVIRWKPAIDARELKYLHCNEPDLYAVIAEAITVKPSKPSFKIEEVA